MSRHEVLDMVVSWTFHAPQERVWRAWSDPDEVMKWWAASFSPLTCPMGFREDGRTLVGMRSDQGWEPYNTWTNRSVKPMDRIEFLQGFADAEGNRRHGAMPRQDGVQSRGAS